MRVGMCTAMCAERPVNLCAYICTDTCMSRRVHGLTSELEEMCVSDIICTYTDACLYALASHVRTKKKIEAGGMMAPKDMIGAGLAKFKNARDDSSSGGGDSDEWSDSD